MILINKNSSNEVVLTLSEKTSIVGATYLFEFINDATKETKLFISQDYSNNKERFNIFNIIETSTEVPLTGRVSLAVGNWKYNIYQQTSTTNLVVANSGAKVENGRVDVVGTDSELNSFNGEQIIYKEFNG
jgi:hypothetical protein